MAASSPQAPIFVVVAKSLEDDILHGSLDEGAQAPSTNELSAFHHINPATALRGLNHLVDAGILHKKRGVGMFVSPGARDAIRASRRAEFGRNFVLPAVAEAQALGLTIDEVVDEVRAADTATGGDSA
ncbi:GntR family transcriptional regulator [Ornithinimicrobium sp. INDO-MA30-4]|nr:GntR family transcriptional regulator [Ornithinimicrobium sp. INDO-MA30-4]